MGCLHSASGTATRNRRRAAAGRAKDTAMPIDATFAHRARPRLEMLYGDRAPYCLEAILKLAARHQPALSAPAKTGWDPRDVVLITYGDQVRCQRTAPLAALRGFLADAGLQPLLSAVHLLPFFPYSSDDGFSVIDYRAVDPALGDWSDVRALGEHYGLMFDLVINHVSRRSRWFEGYRAGDDPYTRFFIEVDPATDLSGVTRPRSTPLLTAVETSRGLRHVWSTFSEDQIDLNFASPDVLLEMLDVLLFYLRQGARIIRLDAIAYLWKRIGTSCIHLPETHQVVKLLRDLVESVAPGVILLTETNVPHEENVSYFGEGDQAQMVYQFSLAPLLLEALLSGDGTLLSRWLGALEPPPPGCTVLNFTASHDGIGVRPLEGIMPEERFERLLEEVRLRGGRVSTKRNADGTESPYELNITYFSALGPPFAAPGNGPAARDATGAPTAGDDALHVRRFLASQAVMLALRGIPGVYFHSLVGTPNDNDGVARTGRARSINRRKFLRDQLDARLADDGSAPARVLAGYRKLLAVRTTQPAFHPDGPQEPLQTGDAALVAFLRSAPDGEQRVLVAANVGPEPKPLDVASLTGAPAVRDLLADQHAEPRTDAGGRRVLAPYQVAWLEIDAG